MGLDAKGLNGQLEVDGDWVTIRRKGLMARGLQGLKGDKRLPISSITAVQYKEATNLTRGYIQFTIPGGTESRGGLVDAAKDENSVLFKKSQAAGFADIREFVEQRIAAIGRGSGGSVPVESGIDKIRKLAELRDAGVLTDAEFETKKAELLRDV